MRVRPPTAVARLADTPRGVRACLRGLPPCGITIENVIQCSDRLVRLMCCVSSHVQH